MADEDDMDIVDIEEEADLGDDSWDEFDDTPKEQQPAGQDEAQPAILKPKKTKKKSSKAFNAIVLVIVAIGGGAFFFGKYLFPSPDAVPGEQPIAAETAATTAAPEGIVELSDESTPPMPAPIESGAAAEQAVAGLTPPPAPEETVPESTGGELTPMPGKQELAPATSDLPDLSAPAAAPAPVESVETVDSGLTPLPVPGEPAPEETIPEIMPEQIAPVELTEAPAPTPEPAPAPIEPVPAATKEPVAEAPTPMPDPALKEQVADLEKTVGDLKGEIKRKDDTIAALKAEIESLSKKQGAMAESVPEVAPAVEKPKPAKPVKKASKPKPAPAVEDYAAVAANPEANAYRSMAERQLGGSAETPAAPKTYLAKPVTSTKAAPIQANSGQWELRSARPGQAILAPKGSNELRSVTVGEIVPGLGRILSINIEGGVWTVRGAKGQIYR